MFRLRLNGLTTTFKIGHQGSRKYSLLHKVYAESRFTGISRRNYRLATDVFGFKIEAPKSDFKIDESILKARAQHSPLYNLVTSYQEHGHKVSQLDPLQLKKSSNPVPELDPRMYCLSESNESVPFRGLVHKKSEGTVHDLIAYLDQTYCKNVGAEFRHLSEIEEREWFAERFETLQHEQLSADEKKAVLTEMIKSQVFDNFLAVKYATVKRYGGEGAESMMGFFTELFKMASSQKLSDVILCQAHRGRLNLLTGLLKFPPVAMFKKMKGESEIPDDVKGSGDVLSHLTSSIDLEIDGHSFHVTMLSNPSHLEAVNPVAVGKSRGRQQTKKEGDYNQQQPEELPGEKVLCVQIHGDAAFIAQGINMETLELSMAPHYRVGGSVHLIVNNQIGYTTPDNLARSSLYTSDLAKMISVPVLHVNGDSPEDLVKMTRLAMEYRHKFRKDVFVDLLCFRRWGHNELDDPTFTNPEMYGVIRSRQSIPDKYAQQLMSENILTEEELKNIISSHQDFLSSQFSQVDSYKPKANHLEGNWQGLMQAGSTISTWDTGMDKSLLAFIGAKSVEFPDDFNLHAHLRKSHVQARINKLMDGNTLDWSTAEALALGSLMYQGYNVRISGQDVGRGTFSQRHAMLVDQETSRTYIPLNNMTENQTGMLELANSILSEEAVLGFEYGMSVENPRTLVIWEAQFGDFFNGAQIIIDTFVTSGETKWLMQNGLVMLLPHGYDGAGPEHSSCRIERFLQLCDSQEDQIDGDDVNVGIVNPTTPAQYFHLLRRQIIRNFRKPLIVAAPKTLLRLPAAVSSFYDMAPGNSFLPVIGDTSVKPEKVKRIVFCSGKHYYALKKQRDDNNKTDAAIVRLESLCPFPASELQKELAKYSGAKEFIWSQEEHRNMGPWSFVAPRFENLVGCKLKYVGRKTLATPAVGIGALHRKEAQEVLNSTFS